MKVDSSERGKVAVLIVAIVAILAFAGMNFMNALKAKQAVGAPAGTAPAAANSSATNDVNTGTTIPVAGSGGVNPFRMTVDPRIVGEGAGMDSSRVAASTVNNNNGSKINIGNMRTMPGFNPDGSLKGSLSGGVLPPVIPDVGGIAAKLEGTMIGKQRLAVVKQAEETKYLYVGDDLCAGFKIRSIQHGYIVLVREKETLRLEIGKTLNAVGTIEEPPLPSM